VFMWSSPVWTKPGGFWVTIGLLAKIKVLIIHRVTNAGTKAANTGIEPMMQQDTRSSANSCMTSAARSTLRDCRLINFNTIQIPAILWRAPGYCCQLLAPRRSYP
jgi:hypothetical protein